MKEDCKNEHDKMQEWKNQEAATVSVFEIKKDALIENVRTFRKLVLEWKEAKSAKNHKKRKSTDSKKKSPKGKKVKPPPTPPPTQSSSSDDDDGSRAPSSCDSGDESDQELLRKAKKTFPARLVSR